MKHLPKEIWTQIVEDHLPKNDAIALSTTSSFFSRMAQASLYKHVVVGRNPDPRVYDSHNNAFVRFVEALGKRPELGSFVHSLAIGSYGFTRERDTLHPILSKLALFTQLRSLRLFRFNVGSNLCSALRCGRHPRLIALELDRCEMSRFISDTDLPPTAGSTLSKITIHVPETSGPAEHWTAVVPAASLRKLDIHDKNSDYLDLLMSNFRKDGRTHTLTTLVFSCPRIPDSFVSFLTVSPQITCLEIGFWGRDESEMVCLRALPPDAIPLLENFTGSAEISTIIVPGRPVHTVHVSFDPLFPLNILLPLRGSTTLITELGFMDSTVVNFGTFLQYAPVSIRHLRLQDFDESTVFSCFPALPRLKNLHILANNSPRATKFNLTLRERKQISSKREEIVHKFSRACPSIQEFRFREERWLAREQGDWEHYFSE